MKKKSVCIFKGKNKQEFEILIDRFESYKKVVEYVAHEIDKTEKLLWELIKNITPKSTNINFNKRPFKFKYNHKTGEIYEFEQ